MNQMRHHQTLHTLLHHPLQSSLGCRGGREGSWEGVMTDGRGKKEVVDKGLGG